MRFGVKDENTADHMTWEICRESIDQCYKGSSGNFFLSLQSDKYGYCPLPKYLRSDLIHSLFNSESNHIGIDAKDIFFEWYKLDMNAIPNQYVLQSLKSQKKNEFFEHVLPFLRDGCLDSIPFEILERGENDSILESLLVNRSITEWETLYAMKLNKERCCWVKRILLKESLRDPTNHNTLVAVEEIAAFCDTLQSASKQKKLEILKGKMESLISQIYSLSVNARALIDGQKLSTAECSAYILEWKETMLKHLSGEVETAVRKRNQWRNRISSHWKGIPMEFVEEILHNNKLTFLKSSLFTGKQILIMNALKILDQSNNRTVSLVVIGNSGTGKTMLMAKLFTLLSEKQIASTVSPRIPMIIRYCGTSTLSTSGLNLIQSILLQLYAIYENEEKVLEISQSFPLQTYEEANLALRNALKVYPVYLFIDSLDQLSNRDEARSKLKFIANFTELHADSRIIVSTLPDEKDTAFLSLCETASNSVRTPILNITENADDPQALKCIFYELLNQKGRSISDDQYFVISSSLAVEPTMLYLTLAVEVAQYWKSYDCDIALKPTVNGIINQIFDTLEKDFGKYLVSWGIALITFSRDGINDQEMIDCLAMRAEVMQEVFQYSSLLTFPMHVWLRFKIAIKNLIVEQENNCIRWYHRQLQEAAFHRYYYLKLEVHKTLAEYFSLQPLCLNAKDIWWPNPIVNVRKVRESYYHFIRGGFLELAIKGSCSVEFCYACVLAKDQNEFIASMCDVNIHADENDQLSKEDKKRLLDYCSWLRREATYIAIDPLIHLSISVYNEPKTSTVRNDLLRLSEEHKQSCFLLDSNLIFCQEIGGRRDSWELNLLGHSDAVFSVSWQPKLNCRIASASKDCTVKVWDVVRGNKIFTLEGHLDTVNCVDWNPEGTKIVSGSKDSSLKIWDAVLSGKLLVTMHGHSGEVQSVAWNPEGSTIASGGRDSRINLWNALSGELYCSLTGTVANITSVKWNFGGSRLAAAGGNNVIEIWEITENSGAVKSTCSCMSNGINCVAWHPDGTKIAAGAWNKDLIIWDAFSGQRIATFQGSPGEISAIDWSKDGSRIVSGSINKAVNIWDIVQGGIIQRFIGHSESVTSLSWNSEGTKILSGSIDKSLKLWEIGSPRTNQLVRSVFQEIESVSWHPNGQEVAVATRNSSFFVVDCLTGDVIRTMKGHTDEIRCVSFDNNGLKIASGSLDHLVKVWDSISGECLATFEGHNDGVITVGWDSLGNVISGSWDRSMKIWDISTGSVLKLFEPQFLYEGISAISWNNEISTVAIAVDGASPRVIIYDISTGQELQTVSETVYLRNGLYWNPVDCNQLAIASWMNNYIIIWDTARGEEILRLIGHKDSAMSVDWNADGTRLISGSQDGSLLVWDISNGKSIFSFVGHKKPISCVRWNATCTKFASGSWDSTVRLWSAYDLTSLASNL